MRTAREVGLSPRTLEKMRVYGGGPIFEKNWAAGSFTTSDDLLAWRQRNKRLSTSDRVRDGPMTRAADRSGGFIFSTTAEPSLAFRPPGPRDLSRSPPGPAWFAPERGLRLRALAERPLAAIWRLSLLRAGAPAIALTRLPGVQPGAGDSAAPRRRPSSSRRWISSTTSRIAALIPPTVAPDYWRHLHRRLDRRR